MTVTELIEQLKDLNPDLEVMIDATIPGSGMFKLTSLIDVCEIQTPEGEEYILLEKYESEYNQNKN